MADNNKTAVADKKWSRLLEFMEAQKKMAHPESQLIAILHKAQEINGYLDQEVMDLIAETMSIPTSHIWGVATFYHFFNLTPRGKYVISVCLGTACYVKGAEPVLEAIKDELKIDIGQTTSDQLFTLAETRCLGACGLAPVAMINDKIYGGLTPKKVVEILMNLRKKP